MIRTCVEPPRQGRIQTPAFGEGNEFMDSEMGTTSFGAQAGTEGVPPVPFTAGVTTHLRNGPLLFSGSHWSPCLRLMACQQKRRVLAAD
ncbi:hypothetical protein RUM44_013460 [Polyplax serrata]|uniref:Uncharacterized protein n=1 Tax=Polyplax serrata TaxID=468196 RepID=A0ABR1BE83_POLSC